jgi:hypothetical protein
VDIVPVKSHGMYGHALVSINISDKNVDIQFSAHEVKCVRIILHISNIILLNIAIVLSVLLRYTDSDYPVGIFKLFPQHMSMKKNGTNSSKRSDIYKSADDSDNMLYQIIGPPQISVHFSQYTSRRF